MKPVERVLAEQGHVGPTKCLCQHNPDQGSVGPTNVSLSVHLVV